MSDNEKESGTHINSRSENAVPSHNVLSDNESSANTDVGTENVVPSTNPPSSGNIVSLACVSSETPNLQRIFRPGG